MIGSLECIEFGKLNYVLHWLKILPLLPFDDAFHFKNKSLL